MLHLARMELSLNVRFPSRICWKKDAILFLPHRCDLNESRILKSTFSINLLLLETILLRRGYWKFYASGGFFNKLLMVRLRRKVGGRQAFRRGSHRRSTSRLFRRSRLDKTLRARCSRVYQLCCKLIFCCVYNLVFCLKQVSTDWNWLKVH